MKTKGVQHAQRLPMEQSVRRTLVVKVEMVGVAAFGGIETLIRILSNKQN